MKKITILFILCCSMFTYGKKNDLYLFHLDYPGLGEVNFYMDFEIKEGKEFIAYTNDKTVYKMIPFYQKTYLRFFGKGKKRGAAIRIINGKIEQEHYKGEVTSVLGRFEFKARSIGDQIKGTLSNKEVMLYFTAEKVGQKRALMDYNELYRKIESELKQKIYNPEILKRKDWNSFLKNLKTSLFQADDDLDALLPFFYLVSKVKTSHLYLTKTNPLSQIKGEKDQNYEYKQLNENVSELKVFQFSLKDYEDIQRLIKDIHTPYLIIDLSSCSGGDFSSLLLASSFINEEYLVGYFLGNKYYAQRQEIPTLATLQSIQPFIRGDLDDFYANIDDKGILVGKVIPSRVKYNGKIIVLTSSGTASAAEPLVYFLKQYKLATIIGENTAGQMLSAKSSNILKNWYLTLPIADYFTIDNVNLDQVGVKPDIEVESAKALEKAMEIIGRKE